MFAFAIAAVLAVASVSFALPTLEVRDAGSCSTGPVQCCASIAPSTPDNSATLAGLIPINLQSLAVPIGVNCIPVSALLAGGTAGTCSGQTACCDGVDNTGTVPVGLNCSPIGLNV